jgi:long-chain fatty acid transport protein
MFKLAAVMLSSVCAMNTSANGFRLADQDAFATARGEAFVATADNPSAVYYNPAGITQLEGGNLRGGLYGIYLNPGYTPTNHSRTFHSSDNLAAVPQLFYTCTPKDSRLSLGLGVYAPYGGSMNWPQDTGFRTVATEGKLTYLTLNPVVAVKLLPQLSFGGGLMVNYVNMDLEQGLRASYLPPAINFFRFKGDGWSVGYNAGILWQPHPKISFGATFRSSARMNFQGNTDFELEPGAYNTPAQRSAEASFTFPLTTVLGVSYRPTPKWNIEFDANYTGWNSFDTVTIEQSPPPLSRPFTNNVPVNLNWQASWMYELGATRYFDSGWHASAGIVYNENSVPNTYYTPLAADMDRYFLSAGAGYKGKRFNFDIAYQFGYGPTHTVTGSTPSSTPGQFAGKNLADGRYDFISHAVMLTVGMHF